MKLRRCIQLVVVPLLFLLPVIAWAAHPLITDDTGTQGKGKYQIEVNGQYDTDKEAVEGVSVKTTGGQAAMVFSIGVHDDVDIILSQPYLWSKVKEDGVVTYNDRGFSDIKLDLKWRMYANEGYSFAIKTGASYPTGRDTRGLGAGKMGSSIFFIASEARGAAAFHLNAGYIRNENTLNEREDIWHASFATTYELLKGLKLAGNIGIERNRDKATVNDPAHIVGGVIYSPVENFDIDFGVKYGLSKTETDLSYLAGITLRF